MYAMCGSELTPKPSGLSASALSLLKQAQRVALGEPQASSSATVPSPCISVCHMSADTGWCEGCWRSLDEIGGWGQTSNESKRLVWSRIAQRITAHTR
jgi:predicted Fe-S protein YdhL (DUF1289 family)